MDNKTEKKVITCPTCNGKHTGPKEVGQGGCNRCGGMGTVLIVEKGKD